MLWLAGYPIVLASIPVAFYNLVVAYILAAAGVVAGFISYFKGDRVGKAASPRAGEPTKMAVR